MNARQRSEFRKSREWKAFKHKCRLRTSKDYITNEPLQYDWNLHHLDLNVQRYDNLDPNRFTPLNPKTHELVHELYKFYKKDRRVLDRLKTVLDRMYALTNEPVGLKAKCEQALKA